MSLSIHTFALADISLILLCEIRAIDDGRERMVLMFVFNCVVVDFCVVNGKEESKGQQNDARDLLWIFVIFDGNPVYS